MQHVSASSHTSKRKGSGWIGALKRSFGRQRGFSGKQKNVPQPDRAAAAPPHVVDSTDLPLVIWMEHIFPLLDRSTQNCLAAAHPDIAATRRNQSQGKLLSMDWPPGTTAKRFSRPVKHVTFVPAHTNSDGSTMPAKTNQDKTLLVAYCKPKVISCDRLVGPRPFMDPATTPHAHRGIVTDLQVCPTDTSLLATASKNDGTIRLWKSSSSPVIINPGDNNSNNNNNNNHQCIRILQIHQHDLRHMAWSPRGDKIVSWGHDGFVRVSSAEDGAMQSRFWKTRIEVVGCHRTVAFDPTGTAVTFAHNNDRV